MRPLVVLHYSALLLMGIGLTMFLPLGFSLYYGESDTTAFATSIAITVGTGLLLFFSTPRGKGTPISQREALALVSLSWILASLIGSLPYQLAGVFPNYIDCLFESTSGFTTTGASVMDSIESQPHGILIWRNFTQWLGGMGIVVLFVSLFPLLGVGTAYLFEAESPGPEVQKLRAHIRDTSRTIWILYAGLTALEVLLLLLVGRLSFFDSLCHSFSTMAIGGFSTQNASIGAFDSLNINIIVICFMFMAGINFALYYSLLWRRTWKTFWTNTEFRLYAFIMLSACLLIAWDLIANADYPTGKAFEEAAFTGASIQTTTGFSISNFDLWPSFSRLALLVLMIIGASAGSTGGGMKVIRIAVLAKYAYRQIRIAFNPQAVIPLKLGGRVLSEKVVSRTVGFAILYLGVIASGALIMSALGYDFTTAISSVVAAVGNIGPGLGLVGPSENYAFISGPGKAVLMFCMLIGRLELLTMLALFTPVFWRWR
ncbi:MAG: TrkH family potassium uptake protein [Chloroflexota bacterium]|nr:TrkH family potassium uptake protein [Chloroflexota bacterium]